MFVMEKNQIADRELFLIANKLEITKYLIPVNLDEEKKRFFSYYKKNKPYNPRFFYKKPKLDLIKIKKKLKNLSIKTDSPASLFLKKIKKNLILKADLIKSIGKQKFSQYSILLYGKPSKETLNIAKNELKGYKDYKARDTKNIRSKKALEIFKKEIKNLKLPYRIEGYLKIKKFIKNGGNIKDLYIGKVGAEDISLLKKLTA